MAVVTTDTADAVALDREVEGWVLDAEAAADEHVVGAGTSSEHVGALARAALVSASLKARTIQMTAQAVLADARAEAGTLVAEAHAEATTLIEGAKTAAGMVLTSARANATAILDGAVARATEIEAETRQIRDGAAAERDAMLNATLERIAELSGGLIGMAEQIVASAEDPRVARAQLAHFVLALTDTAEQLAASHTDG